MPDDNDEDNVVRLEKLKKQGFGEKYRRRERPNLGSTFEAIKWLNEDHFKTLINGKFKIIRENPNGTLDFMDKKDFINNHEEDRVLVDNKENGTTKSTPITEIWLKSSDARKYDRGLTFDPSHVGNTGEQYNLFKGWRIKPIAGDVAPFVELMKDVICAGDEENFNYLVALIADMFQRPHLKPGVAVVVRSDEGVGKSFFVERLCDLVTPYYFPTSNPSYIFGDHNGQLKDKLLLHLEEALWAGSKKDESLLKHLITGPGIPINDKFVPVYSVPNHLHLFITGNPDWLVSAGFKARRIFALHASEKYIQDTEYFGKLAHWFHKEGGAEALMHYFLNHKSDIDLRKVPVTDELVEQKQLSMGGVAQWLVSIVNSSEMPYGEFDKSNGHVQVIKAILLNDYNNSPIGKRHQLTERAFGAQLLSLLPLVVDGVAQKEDHNHIATIVAVDNIKIRDSRDIRRNGYDIPDLKAVRSALEFKLGGKINWSSASDEWTVLKGNTDFDFSLYKERWRE